MTALSSKVNQPMQDNTPPHTNIDKLLQGRDKKEEEEKKNEEAEEPPRRGEETDKQNTDSIYMATCIQGGGNIYPQLT